MTLLILEIHVPAVRENETMMHSLLHEWTSFLALLIGFFTLLTCWINHHYMFTVIRRCNSPLMLVNGFKLLIVTITPFATALLAKTIGSDWQKPAISVYCFNFALMGYAMTGIWLYAKRAGFIEAGSPAKLKAATRLYILASLLSTAIWLMSYFSVTGSLFVFCCMFVIFIFPEKMVLWQVNRMAIEFQVNEAA